MGSENEEMADMHGNIQRQEELAKLRALINLYEVTFNNFFLYVFYVLAFVVMEITICATYFLLRWHPLPN